MQPAQEDGSPLRQIPLRQGRHDPLQQLSGDWIGGVELGVTAQQANQKQQPLQIEQPRVAMELPVGFTGPGATDAAVQRRQLGGQQGLQVVVVGGHHGAEGRKPLSPTGPEVRIG